MEIPSISFLPFGISTLVIFIPYGNSTIFCLTPMEFQVITCLQNFLYIPLPCGHSTILNLKFNVISFFRFQGDGLIEGCIIQNLHYICLLLPEKMLINQLLEDKKASASNQSLEAGRLQRMSSITLPSSSIMGFHKQTSMRSIKYLPKLGDLPTKHSKVSVT